MLGDLIGFIAIVALVVVVWRQQQRLRVLEFDLEGLRTAFLAHREKVTASGAQMVADATARAAEATATEPATAADATAAAVSEAVAALAPEPPSAEPAATAGPWTPQGDAGPAEAPAAKPERPTIETALGTRWAVWVGSLALALGGIFLVRYSIEAGIFGPELRLVMAAILGVGLVAAGEFIRRTGFQMPVEGVGNAYVPGILTAAGAFTLFGTVYAAHGIYGFIGPATAFTLLGVIGIATIAASLVHGQALAGVGIVGSYLTPVLVASEAPNPWALFGFIAIVLAAVAFIARLRDWKLLMGAGLFGAGAWTLLYVGTAWPADLPVVAFITAVTLAVLAFVWLGRRQQTSVVDGPSIVPGFFIALTAAALFGDPEIGQANALFYGAAFIVAMVAVALYRAQAIALLHAAGAAAAMVFIRHAFSGNFDFDFFGEAVTLQGFPPLPSGTGIVRAGMAIGAVFAAAGLWNARRVVAEQGGRAATWAAWGVAVPLVILFSVWLAFGNLDRDLVHAGVAVALAVIFVLSGEMVARAEAPPLSGGPAISFALSGAGIGLLLALHMAFSPGWTTLLLGASLALPALATRYRSYPVLGWLSAAGAGVVLFRFAIDPSIVGMAALSTAPVFNWLLPGYGVPALGAAFAAWQLARTTGGRPRLVMEAAASFFALIGAAMLVRHAMNDGVLDADSLTLAEQSIYTLIAMAGSAILIALDMRSPSPVFRIGSMIVGLVSVAMAAIQHFVVLNPLFTDESTGKIVFFNLLLLAYLLPALAAGGVALFARGKRPRWYAMVLALLAALLAFAYATLSLRRLFQGEFIGAWRAFGQVETYAYSALWLALGVALLVGGMLLRSQVLRIASGALIVIAVAKVFLFDMSELEGVLRALSFIGLGIVLIGIGLFYQRMLRLGLGTAAAPRPEQAVAPPVGG